MPFAPGAQRQPMGLLDQGGGVGLLDGIAANRNMLMSLGLGLLSGQGNSDAFQNAMLGASQGSRADLLAQKEMQARREKLAQQQAYQALLKQHGFDTSMAADPDLARSAVLSKIKPRDKSFQEQMYEKLSEEEQAQFRRNMVTGNQSLEERIYGEMSDEERGRVKENMMTRRGQQAPSGYRWSADNSKLEPIEGGPAMKEQALPGEIAGRAALAGEFLRDAPTAREKIANGIFEGKEGRMNLALSRGEQGEVYRTIESGVDALRRSLTGAGMPPAEAEEYVSRYKPQLIDTTTTMLSKFDRLQRELESFQTEAYRGRVRPGNMPDNRPGAAVGGAVGKAIAAPSAEEAIAELKRRGRL